MKILLRLTILTIVIFLSLTARNLSAQSSSQPSILPYSLDVADPFQDDKSPAAIDAQIRQIPRLKNELLANPTNFDSVRNLASAYLQARQTNLSFETLENFVKEPLANSNEVGLAIYTLVDGYAEIGNLPKTETSLERLVKIWPDNDQFWYDLAAIKVALGKKSESIKALIRASALNSDLFATMQKDARFDSLREMPEFQNMEATAYAKSAEAHYSQGTNYFSSEQYENAIQEFDQTIHLNPNYTNAYYILGRAYLGSGQYQKAIDDYNYYLNLNPQSAGAYHNRGLAYYRLQQYQQAINDLTQAIEMKSDESWVYQTRGLAYFHIGKLDKSVADFQIAVQLDPNNSDLANDLSIVKMKLMFANSSDSNTGSYQEEENKRVEENAVKEWKQINDDNMQRLIDPPPPSP